MLANTLVLVVSITHLVVRQLIGITRQAHTLGSSMTHSTSVALHGSRGASTMPLTKLFFGAPHKFLAGFDEDHHQAV